MKKIEAIIRPERLDEVKKALLASDFHGMTVIPVHGCGRGKGHTEIFRGREYEINLNPKVKIEIVVSDAQVDQVTEIICEAARTTKVGDGKIFISQIENAIRVRTGETGDNAI